MSQLGDQLCSLGNAQESHRWLRWPVALGVSLQKGWNVMRAICFGPSPLPGKQPLQGPSQMHDGPRAEQKGGL